MFIITRRFSATKKNALRNRSDDDQLENSVTKILLGSNKCHQDLRRRWEYSLDETFLLAKQKYLTWIFTEAAVDSPFHLRTYRMHKRHAHSREWELRAPGGHGLHEATHFTEPQADFLFETTLPTGSELTVSENAVTPEDPPFRILHF